MVDAPQKDREEALARHNLYASFAELKRIKQTISEGRLWEYLEIRAHTHPALLQAVKRLKRYKNYIERHSPVTKKSGLFFFSNLDLMRPEVIRHKRRLENRYTTKKCWNSYITAPILKKTFS